MDVPAIFWRRFVTSMGKMPMALPMPAIRRRVYASLGKGAQFRAEISVVDRG